jgi:hypothetical protein
MIALDTIGAYDVRGQEARMEKNKSEVLEGFREDLVAEAPESEAILEQLESAGLVLGRAEPIGMQRPRRTWLLYWQPPEALCKRFDLAPEILALLTAWREAHAQDIDAAEDAIRRDHRLDRGVVLLLAQDEKAGQRLGQAIQHTGRTYLDLSFADIRAAADPQRWLREMLIQRIGQSDLFAASRPVYGWDFIGRERELREVRGRLREGHPIGLYGLRKVGKTSLLLMLRNQFVDDAREGNMEVLPIHIDLLRLSFAEMNRTGVLRHLLLSMLEAMERMRLPPTLLGLDERLDRECLGKLDASTVEVLAARSLERLIDWASLEASQPAVVVFIDEYERLLGGSRFPVADGLDIYDFMRGLVQQYPQRFNFVIAGLDRRLASRPRYGQRQNPLFNFAVDYPLAGLERHQLTKLFRKIGRRLSLHFESGALDLIWEETGGHPYLAREYGRLIDHEFPVDKRADNYVNRAFALRYRKDFRQRVRNSLEEIHQALFDLDPQAPDVLRLMHVFPDDAVEALEQLKPETVDVLRQYGILASDRSVSQLRIGCLGPWLEENPSDPQLEEAHA